MRSIEIPFLFALCVGALARAEDVFAPRFSLGAPARTLTGVVVDAEHKPVGGADVVAIGTPRAGYQGLFADDPTAPTMHTATNAEGAFRFDVARHRAFEIRVRTTDGRIGYVPTILPGENVSVCVAPPAELTVELVSAIDGRPLFGVEVAAQWTETSLLRQFANVPHRISTATTGADGQATLTNLAPGMVDLVYEPSASGLAPARPWRVLAGEKARVTLRVGEPRRTFTGRVTDRAGNPIPGARVGTSVQFDRFTIADDTGHFEIATCVPLGDLWLYVQADGFALEQRLVADPEHSTSAILIELPPGRAVSGRIVDVDGKPLAGVPIVVVHDPFTTVPDQVRGVSAVDGSFRLHGLRVDVKHVLVASSPGRALCVRALGEAEFGAPDLNLGALELQPESVIAGRFLDSEGAPVARGEVSCAMTPPRMDETPLDQPLDMPIGAVKTDADGGFRFEGLLPGAVALTALAQTTMKREILGIERGGHKSGVVIRSIAPLRPADAAQGEVGGTLAARVLLSDGKPAARAAVSVFPEDDLGAAVRQGFADEAGTFTFTELHGARYRLVVELRDGLPDTSPLRARCRLTPEELAALVGAPADSPARSIRLHDVVMVKGSIVDPRMPEGRPWFVRAEPVGALGAPTCVGSDERGRFSFAMEKGAKLTLWLSPLNIDPGTPRSALDARVVAPFPVPDLTAGPEALTIHVP